eukprot:10896044-Alexandrium_andersonii.AAC.1
MPSPRPPFGSTPRLWSLLLLRALPRPGRPPREVRVPGCRPPTRGALLRLPVRRRVAYLPWR